MKAVAFAPATIGNVSIGFDILGMAISGVGDQVTVSKIPEKHVQITEISGSSDPLPTSAEKNTAGAALMELQKMAKCKFGFAVAIKKGIPMGSGMGGSAASAVAAVVAGNALLAKPLDRFQLMHCALQGENIASGGMHPDNVAPCLFGGLTLTSTALQPQVIPLPFPKNLHWLLVHPNLKIETKTARQILSKQVDLFAYVDQSARLAAFICGLHAKNNSLIHQGFQDRIIEPQRQHLIPGFAKLKLQAEKMRGVLGFSISGSGPSIFALTETAKSAEFLKKVVQSEFRRQGVESQAYSGSGSAKGAWAKKVAEGRSAK